MKMEGMLFVGVVVVAALATLAEGWCRQKPPGRDNQIFATGEPTPAAVKKRPVHVMMVEVGGEVIFAPNEFVFKRGENIRFVIRNETSRTHEFVIGSPIENLGHAETMKLSPVVQHDEPNARMVPPQAEAVLDWSFTKTGNFEITCLLSGHTVLHKTAKIAVIGR